VGINYAAIAVGIGLLLGIWAFVDAESVGGRIFIAATMACLFFLPILWRRSTASLVSYIGWFIFIKLRGVNLR